MRRIFLSTKSVAENEELGGSKVFLFPKIFCDTFAFTFTGLSYTQEVSVPGLRFGVRRFFET